LKSRPIADAIIDRFNLRAAYQASDMTAARNTLESNTKVSSEKSGLISISATDRDKSRATGIANAYPEELRILSKRISVTEASKRRLFFEDQLKDARNDLTSAEAAFQQVQQNKGLLHLDAQSGVIIGSLANVRAQIAAKQVELEALRSYSTEHNPDVQLEEHELSALQGEAARIEQHASSSDFSDLGIKDVPKAGEDYVRALQDVQYRQAFFDLMLRQYEAARLDEAKEAAVIQVVEPAIEPDRRSSPKRSAILIVSTIVGLFLGCLLARFLHWAEHELSTPESTRALETLKRAFAGEHARQPAESHEPESAGRALHSAT
jgi:tyrosine-protein kinase Etk/Wzc